MSKVNFVSEFNAIMRYARDHNLSLRERMLWLALFYIANDRAAYNGRTSVYDWPDGFIQVSNGELNLYCRLDKRSIETLRNTMKQRGLLDFQPGVRSKRNPAYQLHYLTAGCKNVPSDAPSDVPSDAPSDVPSNAPSDVPSDAPSDAPVSPVLGGVLGPKKPPAMPPYSKRNQMHQPKRKADAGVNQSAGFVDLNAPPACSGFVPLPWEEEHA